MLPLSAGQSQPHLTNLRSNLLLFLRDRVLDGRDPSPSTRDEVVQYFADKITPSLIASWVSVERPSHAGAGPSLAGVGPLHAGVGCSDAGARSCKGRAAQMQGRGPARAGLSLAGVGCSQT